MRTLTVVAELEGDGQRFLLSCVHHDSLLLLAEPRI